MEISSTSTRRWSVLVLATLLGLAMTLATVSAGRASSGQALAAKKKHKCKKKGKKSAAAAKKKKCGKKKSVPPVTTPAGPTEPIQPSGPTQRATLTWNNGSDLDLFAWDPAGNGGYFAGVYPDAGDTPIPDVSFPTDDEDGFGPEQLIDLRSPSTRQFSYLICVADTHTLNGTIATLNYVRADGSSGTFTTSPGDLDDYRDQVPVVVGPGSFTPPPPDVNEC
jgi:hypothetical protein